MRARLGDNGVTLVELLVAMLVTQAIAMALVPVFVISLHSAGRARGETSATTLAWQKLEELRAASWGSPALAPSPSDALDVDAPGFADLVDTRGVPRDPTARQSAPLFVRRWSVQHLSVGGSDDVEIQVFVAEYGRRGPAAATARRDGDARVVAIRTRR